MDLLTRRTTWLEEAMASVNSKIASLEMEALQVGTARREAQVEKDHAFYSLLLQSPAPLRVMY